MDSPKPRLNGFGGVYGLHGLACCWLHIWAPWVHLQLQCCCQHKSCFSCWHGEIIDTVQLALCLMFCQYSTFSVNAERQEASPLHLLSHGALPWYPPSAF